MPSNLYKPESRIEYKDEFSNKSWNINTGVTVRVTAKRDVDEWKVSVASYPFSTLVWMKGDDIRNESDKKLKRMFLGIYNENKTLFKK